MIALAPVHVPTEHNDGWIFRVEMADFTFLVCTERSGSNFATNLMNGHRAVCGPPPTHLFRLFGSNMDRYANLRDDTVWYRLIEDMVEGFGNTLGVWSSSVTRDELASAVSERSSAALLRYLYEKEAAHDGASHLLVKENHCYSLAPFLIAHFPTCRFLVLVRDPRDVAGSWANTKGIPGGIEKAVDVWLTDQRRAIDLYSQLRDAGRSMVVRYEDLLTDTESTLGRITSWMGLVYDEAMVRFYEHPRTQRNARRIEAWSNLSKGIMHDNYAKFSKSLTPEEIEYVEIRCGELMRRFGYRPTKAYVFSSPREREQALAKLQPNLRQGSYQLQEEERSIRGQRLEFIESILGRDRICVTDP